MSQRQPPPAATAATIAHRRRQRWRVLATAVAAAAVAGCATAPQVATTLPPARASSLELVDDERGERHDVMALLRGQRATALVFWSAQCPCVRRYQARVEALRARWQGEGVRVLGVAANGDESARDLSRATRERGLQLEVWRDPGGRLAAALGARSTPTVVVLTSTGQVAYHGWLDNEREPGVAGREPWLDDALARLLGGDDSFERRPTYGCRIPVGGATAAAHSSPCGCKPAAPPQPAPPQTGAPL